MAIQLLNKGQRSTAVRFLQALPTKTEKSKISKAEAEILINNVANASVRVFKNIVLLMDNRGYVALGFSKPQDCLRKRLPELSNSYISRLLSACDTYLKLDKNLTHLNKVTEATFRPLQNVSDKDALLVWKRVLSVPTGNRITSRHIERSIAALNINAIETKQLASTLKLDSVLKRCIDTAAQNIGQQLILPNAKSKQEWDQLAILVYKQLLQECPSTLKALVQS